MADLTKSVASADERRKVRSQALAAAAASWAGISAFSDRNQSVIETARAFEAYLWKDDPDA